MVAGFTTPSGGSIEIDGRDMTRVPPHRRDVGMVFQNYALFPHMTAAQNIAFPLQMRGVPATEIAARGSTKRSRSSSSEAFGDRYPRQLSGGQQQRIALARAVVFEPRLLLMDEPLGALDRKLREALQLEIMRVSRQLGATVIYVTHDQEEALVMSDRIAIFSQGPHRAARQRRGPVRPAGVAVRGRLHRRVTSCGGVTEGGWVTRDSRRWRVGRDSGGTGVPRGGAAAALVVRPEQTRILGPSEEAPAQLERRGRDRRRRPLPRVGSQYGLTLSDGQRAAVASSATKTGAPGARRCGPPCMGHRRRRPRRRPPAAG